MFLILVGVGLSLRVLEGYLRGAEMETVGDRQSLHKAASRAVEGLSEGWLFQRPEPTRKSGGSG